MPLTIDYDPERELAIADAIGMLDELGDVVDGTIDESEANELIRALQH
ncbi:MAG TPA: hypothetical protein VES36_07565 [Candidatus Limnocylindrales bacterium]|nr:hypothetical protein [Candidatus Limnocylindrales bacterium]